MLVMLLQVYFPAPALPGKIQVVNYRNLTSSAPADSRTSATSVWPFSHENDSGVSPVAVVALTLAPTN